MKNKSIRYLIIFISSVFIPEIPLILLYIKSYNIDIISFLLLSTPVIISFIILSCLIRDSITRDPNKLGLFHYISKISKHLEVISGIFYYLSTIITIATEIILIKNLVTLINPLLIILPYIIIGIFFIMAYYNININSRYIDNIAIISLIFIIIIFIFSIFSFKFNIKVADNINPLIFTLIYNISIFSGIDILTYYSDYNNNRILGNVTFIGTLIISILLIISYISFISLFNTLYYPYLIYYFLPFGILNIYIWYYTSNFIINNLAEENLITSTISEKNKYNSPYIIFSISTILIFTLSTFTNVNNILSFFSVSILIIYIIYIISYIKIKVTSKYFNRNRMLKLFLAIFSLTLFIYFSFYYLSSNTDSIIFTIITIIIILLLSLKLEWKKNKKLIKFYFSKLYFIPYLYRKIFYKKDIQIIESFVKENYNILDFGPFSGDISIDIAKNFNVKVYAIDISKDIIDRLSKKVANLDNYYLHIAKKDEIPKFLYNNIDLIIIYENLKFIINKYVFVKNIYKTLKENGKFISIVYTDIIDSKDVEKSIEEIVELLRYHGIKIKKIKIKKLLYKKYIIIGEKYK
ncbi:hypothetical protein MJ1_0008 [Nanobdella aerobiophila]|uniref:Methyltransferase domain-containing protein n=1 Tax=Nanobdella aerobiophila TaxID=2586965 RepID=A0A915WRG4_9ARCH|nr:class I SAM-dependent methyltransferase [Nanobdella aerobiophila]BBL45189.1 hypothetical protein MJ1_0008 [Nanobdella aerobiophila]